MDFTQIIANLTAGISISQVVALCWLSFTVIQLDKQSQGTAKTIRRLEKRVSYMSGKLGYDDITEGE